LLTLRLPLLIMHQGRPRHQPSELRPQAARLRQHVREYSVSTGWRLHLKAFSMEKLAAELERNGRERRRRRLTLKELKAAPPPVLFGRRLPSAGGTPPHAETAHTPSRCCPHHSTYCVSRSMCLIRRNMRYQAGRRSPTPTLAECTRAGAFASPKGESC
jgi:hypothetical protein